MKHLATSALALLALAAPALADGIDLAHVPAKAQAIAHVDFEALANSQLARLMAESSGEFNMDMDLGEHHPMLAGIRPLRDVRSVTVFALDVKKEQAGVILRVSQAGGALLTAAQAIEGYEAVQLGDRVVHSWGHEGERVLASVFEAGGTTDQLVLISNDTTVMGTGLAVLEGSAANLTSRPEGLMTSGAQPGAIVYVATDRSLADLGHLDPSSKVAGLVQGLVLQLGEQRGEIFATLALQAESEQDTLKVQQVLQGITALAGLMTSEVEHGEILQRLASSLSYKAYGNQLFVEFTYGLEALIRDIETLEGGF